VSALPDLSPALRALAAEVGGPLLALDASATVGSVAAVTATVLVERTLDATSMPSESLAGVLGEAIHAAGGSPAGIAGIVVGLGPGSFTGLRVALATVKGLAYGCGTPVYGVSSLALIAAGRGPGLVAPVLDARRGDLFCALYDVGDDGVPRALLDDGARRPAELVTLLAPHRGAALHLVGFAPPAFAEVAALSPNPPVPVPSPRAAAGLLLAAGRIRAGDADDLAALTPRYLRVSEAERVLRGE
jgi:tRNA threonylcarbamoyladenosine biosynthesis protein TsaB